MRTVQVNGIVNVHRNVERLPKGFITKKVNVIFDHVLSTYLVPKPEIKEINETVVINDTMEVYA